MVQGLEGEMIFLYIIFLLCLGINIHFLLTSKEERGHFASAIFYSSVIPGIYILILNTFNIPITHSIYTYGLFIFNICLSAMFYKDWKSLLYNLKQSTQQLSLKYKITFSILILAVLMHTLHYTLMPLREGDAHSNWAWKAAEWVQLGSITFTDTHRTHGLYEIIKQYPLLHSSSMMGHLLIDVFVPAHIVKFNDFLFFWLIMATFYSILTEYFKVSKKWSFIVAIMLAFSQRQQILYLGAGFAEINLNAMSLFSFYLLLSRRYYLLGFVAGCMSITKNEGLYRFILTMLPALIIFKPKRPHLKELMGAISIFATIKIINHANLPDKSLYNEYTHNLNLSFTHIKTMTPIVLEAMIRSFRYEGILKCPWIAQMLTATFGIILYRFNSIELKKYFYCFYTIFILNFLFNSLPMLISSPPGTLSYDPHNIAINLISRLNCQSFSFLTLSVFCIGFDLYLDLKRINSKNVSTTPNII